jgi:hypothetical protein
MGRYSTKEIGRGTKVVEIRWSERKKKSHQTNEANVQIEANEANGSFALQEKKKHETNEAVNVSVNGNVNVMVM